MAEEAVGRGFGPPPPAGSQAFPPSQFPGRVKPMYLFLRRIPRLKAELQFLATCSGAGVTTLRTFQVLDIG